MPGVAFPQWVPGTAVPHLPDQERTAPGLRYYAPLRPPVTHLGVVRCSSLPRYLGRASVLCPLLPGSWARRTPPRHAGSLHLAGRHSYPDMSQGDHWLSQVPSHPCESMPRSQTPVVSWTLALASPGLLPSGHCTPSAFPSLHREDILWTTTIHISGLHHAACFLVPSSFVRPLLGVHVECTTDLLAGLCSGGICPLRCAPTG